MPPASPFPILQEPEKHPYKLFSVTRELEAQLKTTVKGEARFDDASRALYTTDSSNYRQVPIGLSIAIKDL